MKKRLLSAAAAAFFIGCPFLSAAQVDYFLKIDGIPGESADSVHQGALQIDSFSWGMSNSGTALSGGGAGAGKVSMQDFHFTTSLSKASPQLMLACASGKHISKAILYVRKAGNVPLEYYTITLTDLVVSSFSQAAPGDPTGGDRPMESISLNFTKIKVDYYEASGAVTTAEVDTTPTPPVGG